MITAAKYINDNYPSASIVLEPAAAQEVHDKVSFPIYTPCVSEIGIDPETVSPTNSESMSAKVNAVYQQTVDMICTFGGDGTILHASSLFGTSARVPPMIPFSMGTLGFLGGWTFDERKRAFREVYMSGSNCRLSSGLATASDGAPEEKDGDGSSTRNWSDVPGYSCGPRRARVLLRHRLQVSLHAADRQRSLLEPSTFAMNEVLLHRGRTPHLAVLSISIGGHFLTDAIADGVIISTPTGSTAYSLSSGGAIVHPAVPALLLTPVCPRSLSFRPLVLPASSVVEIRLGTAARSSRVELSVDGQPTRPVERDVIVRVQGENVSAGDGIGGGVPAVVRGAMGVEYGTGGDRDAHWVGGLNGLLKFNYPFGEEHE